MIFLELFIGFLRVGCFSFGGAYSAIPLIRDVVLEYGWLTDSELSYMIAVSESTPGPIMVNLATYVGSSRGGVLGSVIATTAVVLPAFLIILLISRILDKFLKNKYVQACVGGLVPCVIGIIIAVGVYMSAENIVVPGSGSADILKSLGVAVPVAAVAFSAKRIFKKSVSPILLIVLSALLGIAVWGV